MEAILKEPALLKLGGQRREVTVLFSDIRSFTSIVERLSPSQLQTSFIWGDLVLCPDAKLDLLERETEVEWIHLVQKLAQDFKCLSSIL